MEYKKESEKFSVGLITPSENRNKELIASMASVAAVIGMLTLKTKLKRKRKIFSEILYKMNRIWYNNKKP